MSVWGGNEGTGRGAGVADLLQPRSRQPPAVAAASPSRRLAVERRAILTLLNTAGSGDAPAFRANTAPWDAVTSPRHACCVGARSASSAFLGKRHVVRSLTQLPPAH